MKTQIYFATQEGRIKVGISRNLSKRLSLLSYAAGTVIELIWSTEGNRTSERAVHRELSDYRIFGEWFKDCSEVRDAIARYQKDGLPTPIAPLTAPKIESVPFTPSGAASTIKYSGDIDLFRLPIAEARLELTRTVRIALEALVTEIKERESRGEDAFHLRHKAEQLCASL